MIVKDAKDAARQWVIEEASRAPDFYGAFYHGSTNWLTDDAVLSPSNTDRSYYDTTRACTYCNEKAGPRSGADAVFPLSFTA